MPHGPAFAPRTIEHLISRKKKVFVEFREFDTIKGELQHVNRKRIIKFELEFVVIVRFFRPFAMVILEFVNLTALL